MKLSLLDLQFHKMKNYFTLVVDAIAELFVFTARHLYKLFVGREQTSLLIPL